LIQRKSPAIKRSLFPLGGATGYLPVVEPDPFGPSVDPLGEVLISELPEGFMFVPGPPFGRGLDWPVVVPGAFPAGGTLPTDEPAEDAPLDTPLDVPPGLPAALPDCASAIELESAIAPANAIVANFMGRFLSC
jgi:hypothetical protein